MKKVVVFILANLLIFGSAFAEKKFAVWFVEKGSYTEADSLISLCTADSVTVENGFVKLEGEIKYCRAKRSLRIDRILDDSVKYGTKAKRLPEEVLLLNSNMVLTITKFYEPDPVPEVVEVPEPAPEVEAAEVAEPDFEAEGLETESTEESEATEVTE